MPFIEEAYHEYGDNTDSVLVLGLACPDSDDVAAGEIAAFLTENGFTYPVLMDPDNLIGGTLGVVVYPTSWFFSPDGTLAYVWPGSLNPVTIEEGILTAQAK